jgi:heme/copper-type cytochrome/quinol oxidase subunit 3
MALADTFGDYFGFDEHGTDLRTEVLAGLTTFLTMSYIIVVNPFILAEAIQIPGYEFIEVVQMIAIATILASAVATLVMAVYANRPFGLAPGMGLNAIFTFTVVLALVFAERRNTRGVVGSLTATVLLGLTFLTIKAWEWDLKYSHGKTVSSSIQTSVFYVTTSLHGLHVILGDEGQLRGVTLAWPALQEAGTEALIEFETALDQAKSFRGAIVWAPGGCDHGTMDQVRVGYFDPFREDAERPWVFPVYEFLGTCYDQRGQALERDDPLRVLVPAVR